MPAPTSNGMSTRGRFELPVLAPLDSLTAGTNIPPPPESPIEEKPDPTTSELNPSNVSAVADGAPVNGNGNASQAPAVTAATSPTSPSRPGSIRRFLSRKSMNQSYTNDNTSQEHLGYAGRPESPATFSTIGSKPKNKRSGSWFSRFTGSGLSDRESKRISVVYEDKPAPKGPPAPKLPELDQLKAQVTDKSLDMDAEKMFKNI